MFQGFSNQMFEGHAKSCQYSFSFFSPFKLLIIAYYLIEDFDSGMNSNSTSSYGVRLQSSMLTNKLLSFQTRGVTFSCSPHLFRPVPLPHMAVLPGSSPGLATVSSVSLQLSALIMSSFKLHCLLIRAKASWDCGSFPSRLYFVIRE